MKTGKYNIPGIHNYCDRWCERCQFTSRCAIYESPADIPENEQDIQNKAFWDRIAQNMAQAVQLLQKAAEERGIDLTMSPEEEQEYHETVSRKDEIARKHPLIRFCDQYTKTVDQWLSKTDSVKKKGLELSQQVELGIGNEEEIVSEAKRVSDALEIIQWYTVFMGVKFMRAILGKMDEDDWEDEYDFPKDSDGSAKIALIAAERSIHAWTELYGLMPQEEDTILNLLALLDKIKTMGDNEFPLARKFVRPGFDEV